MTVDRAERSSAGWLRYPRVGPTKTETGRSIVIFNEARLGGGGHRNVGRHSCYRAVGTFEVLPDKNLTGGSVRTGDRAAACGHAKESRGPVRAARRDEILRRYGLPPGTHPDYEIDHLIPLCLGGSDARSNLWPQSRRSMEKTWNAEAKDRLERLMCNMVCDGQVNIATVQQAFATNWIAAYQTYYEGRKRQRRKAAPSP